eukprot:scaffold32007_cov101-Isochrysis_galbana.AAC.4
MAVITAATNASLTQWPRLRSASQARRRANPPAGAFELVGLDQLEPPIGKNSVPDEDVWLAASALTAGSRVCASLVPARWNPSTTTTRLKRALDCAASVSILDNGRPLAWCVGTGDGERQSGCGCGDGLRVVPPSAGSPLEGGNGEALGDVPPLGRSFWDLLRVVASDASDDDGEMFPGGPGCGAAAAGSSHQ